MRTLVICGIFMLVCVTVNSQILNGLMGLPIKELMACAKKTKLGPNSIKDLLAGGSKDLNCGAGCFIEAVAKDKASKDKIAKMSSMLGSQGAEMVKPLLKCLDEAEGDQCAKGESFLTCARTSLMAIAANAFMG